MFMNVFCKALWVRFNAMNAQYRVWANLLVSKQAIYVHDQHVTTSYFQWHFYSIPTN